MARLLGVEYAPLEVWAKITKPDEWNNVKEERSASEAPKWSQKRLSIEESRELKRWTFERSNGESAPPNNYKRRNNFGITLLVLTVWSRVLLYHHYIQLAFPIRYPNRWYKP